MPAAADFFGGGPAGDAWAAGLEQTEDGLVPRFDTLVLHDAILAVHTRARWHEWASVTRPTLVVKGGRGYLQQAEVDQMLARNGVARMALIEDAGHDVHLDASDRLALAIESFLRPGYGRAD